MNGLRRKPWSRHGGCKKGGVPADTINNKQENKTMNSDVNPTTVPAVPAATTTPAPVPAAPQAAPAKAAAAPVQPAGFKKQYRKNKGAAFTPKA
jgi:hypothetical protein